MIDSTGLPLGCAECGWYGTNIDEHTSTHAAARMFRKREAVVQERQIYQSHCEVCNRDVGSPMASFDKALVIADRHNANDMDHVRFMRDARHGGQ